ncbi:MAG: hypothetical protein COY80_02780 [Candidatus Pacebacteria bacterium CG_4_10_14_0_8_um_filter_42_14]|nr:MAG: hypothetical protein COY80_02780 [Candidatus Pacebacteria bacterium CG_4_10_14_0_8_um_filter_42_14]
MAQKILDNVTAAEEIPSISEELVAKVRNHLTDCEEWLNQRFTPEIKPNRTSCASQVKFLDTPDYISYLLKQIPGQEQGSGMTLEIFEACMTAINTHGQRTMDGKTALVHTTKIEDGAARQLTLEEILATAAHEMIHLKVEPIIVVENGMTIRRTGCKEIRADHETGKVESRHVVMYEALTSILAIAASQPEISSFGEIITAYNRKATTDDQPQHTALAAVCELLEAAGPDFNGLIKTIGKSYFNSDGENMFYIIKYIFPSAMGNILDTFIKASANNSLDEMVEAVNQIKQSNLS